MAELIGKDWSDIKSDKLFELKEVSSDDNNVEGDTVKLSGADYFERFRSLFGHEPSPFNMGIYQTIGNKEEEILRATKYIGVLPLLPKKQLCAKERKTDDQLPLAKITSRFGISPTEMIKEVLSGDDYYENPGMLKTCSYSENEWRALAGKNIKHDDIKVMFGMVRGFGQYDVSGSRDGSQSDNVNTGSIEDYGVFEIIDFVNKTKDLCKRSLKRQSLRVEENLTGKVKGRILIQKQIKYNTSRGQMQKVYCSYSAMSENICENQILKYALHLCRKTKFGDSMAEDIRYCMNALAGVPLKKCSLSDFVGLKNNGAYRQYKEALQAAKNVIGRYSLAYLGSGNGDNDRKKVAATIINHKVFPYFIDMNLLFEYYCRSLFRKAVDNYNKSNRNNSFTLSLESSEIAKRRLIKQADGKNPFMTSYIPDIVITYSLRGDKDNATHLKVAAVIDAKYSDVVEMDSEKRARTHQVLFYMKALDCKCGGLISPCKKDETPETKDFIMLKNGQDSDDYARLTYIPLTGSNKQNDVVTIIENYLSDTVVNTIKQEVKNEHSLKYWNDLKTKLLNNDADGPPDQKESKIYLDKIFNLMKQEEEEYE